MVAEQGYVRPDLRDVVMGPIRRRRLTELPTIYEENRGTTPAQRDVPVMTTTVPYAAPAMEISIPPDPDDFLDDVHAGPAHVNLLQNRTEVLRVDPKLLERPTIFTGSVRDWRAWRVRFVAWLCGVDEKFERSLKQAEERGVEQIGYVDDSIKYLDRFLFIQLIGLVQGEYLDLILEAPFGFEAWRKLCMEFEHLTAGRKLLAIEDLIHPEFGD